MASFVAPNLRALTLNVGLGAPSLRVKKTLIRWRESEILESHGTASSRSITITLCYLKEVERCVTYWAFWVR